MTDLLGGPDEQVLVVFPVHPPVRHVRAGLTQAQALREPRVPQGVFTHTVQEVDAGETPGRSLLRDGLHKHVVGRDGCSTGDLLTRLHLSIPPTGGEITVCTHYHCL